MHPKISFFPNSSLYRNSILDAPSVQSGSYARQYLLGNMFGPYSFISMSDGVQELDDVGHSRKNMVEVSVVMKIVRNLFKGLLLFGPPGNGKTILAKAVASESDTTFFNVFASSLTSKWVGEAEKLVRTLFMIDSIMSTRLANGNDSSRRLKSEFLVQFDEVTSNPDDLVIVIGATNKPQELDDTVLRRLMKMIYIPLPDESVRRLILKNKLKGQAFSLPGRDLETLIKEAEEYSGSDLQTLCEEAAMMPIRELGSNILTVNANQLKKKMVFC